MQLALYTDILEQLGRSAARHAFVWDIHGDEVAYDFMELCGKKKPRRLWDDYQECLATARAIVGGATTTMPAYASGTCKNCVWYTACLRLLEAGCESAPNQDPAPAWVTNLIRHRDSLNRRVPIGADGTPGKALIIGRETM